MKVIIVEDNLREADVLKDYILRYGAENDIEFSVGHYTDAELFLKNCKKEYPAIVFFDIELPNIDGMQAARLLRAQDSSVVIVFITKMVQFAQKGYEVNACAFLVKPLTYAEFAMKMPRIVNVAKTISTDSILVPVSNGFYRVAPDNILFVEVMGHSLKLQLTDGVIEVRGTLKSIQPVLEEHGFVRCNNCYLVNSRYIDSVNGYYVNVRGFVLKISQPRRKEFMKELMSIYLGSGK